MSKKINLKAVEMTEDVMQKLEDMGKIIRLCPNRHLQSMPRGKSKGESIYESDALYGPHKLIAVTINRAAFLNFGVHPANEEFLLIGDPESKPLYLNISLHSREKLDKKIAGGTVSADDFICLRVKYNDPYLSFFTMLAGVPHGEAAGDVDGVPGSFYVTEPRDLTTDFTNFGDYELVAPV